MTDIVDSVTRSRMMSGIRGRNTKPEILIRSLLHRQGFRFRLHVRELPGKPDIVLPRYHAAIFVHGCFWHGHDCKKGKLPSSNIDFWKNKILKNKLRDNENQAQLALLSWKVIVIWQCEISKIDKKIETFNKLLENIRH